MIIVKTEYHQVNSTFTYDIPEEEILKEFESLEDFQLHMDEYTDQFHEFIQNYDYHRDDDWWTDNHGGYDVEWEVSE